MDSIKELYAFMSDYLKLTIELFKKAKEIRETLVSSKLELLEKSIRGIEEIEFRVSVMEESLRTILSKISREYKVPLSSLNWDKIEEIGGKEVSRLGRIIEDNLRKLLDENLSNKLLLEKIMFINGELLKIYRENSSDNFYTKNGEIESSPLDSKILEEG